MTEQTASPLINPDEDPWAIPPPSISFDVEPPFTVEGDVVSQTVVQQTDFQTRKPLWWEDGRPRKKVIITLQTKVTEDENEDDGMRQLHIRIPSGLFASIREALTEAGERTLGPGMHLAVTFTGLSKLTAAEKKAKKNPQKEFASLVSAAGDPSEPPF